MAKYELNDDGVVVIVGSGAGGGTLANELCQKGINVVLLEAGKQESIDSFVNDEWASFLQLAWLDKRTTSGTWRVAARLPEPAGLDLQDRGRHHHALGRRLAALPGARVQGPQRSTARSQGANLLDWPITLAELEPYYARAEDKMGVTRTNGIPGLPGNNNFKVMYTGAKRLGYKEVHTGRMAINSEPRHDRPSCQQIGFCFQGCKSVGEVEHALHRDPGRRSPPASSSSGPNATCCRSSTTPPARSRACSTPTRTASSRCRRRGVVCVAGNSIESPRLLLNSASAKFPDGLANSSGQVGRNYMRHMTGSVYAVFDKPVHMFRGTTMAGVIAGRGAERPERAASSAATRWRPWRSACRSWRPSSIPAPGAASSRARWSTTRTWPACGSSARTCRSETNRRHAARRPRRTSSGCRSRTSTSTTTRTTSPCAATPSRRARPSTRRRVPRRSTRPRPIPRPTISAPTG